MDMRALADAVPVRGIGTEDSLEVRSDDDLVTAARDDPSQFVALYDRYFPRVHGYIRLRTPDEATLPLR